MRIACLRNQNTRLPSGLPFALHKQEGFPDMSRLSVSPHELTGQCYLPDKEFRYLRTVIVTAAVYRGFDHELRGKPLTQSINLPAPGRRHTLYFLLRVCRVLCF